LIIPPRFLKEILFVLALYIYGMNDRLAVEAGAGSEKIK